MASKAWQRLGDHLRKTQLLGSIQSALYWDQNTRMPSGGAPWRGEQLTLLASELHARQAQRPMRLCWPMRARNGPILPMPIEAAGMAAILTCLRMI